MKNNNNGFTSVKVGVPAIGDRVIMRRDDDMDFRGEFIRMAEYGMFVRTQERGTAYFDDTWFWKRTE